jgi:hypothetical protein
MPNKIIPLEKPITLFAKEIASIELREPTARDYAQLGEPRLIFHSPEGGGFALEQPDVIRQYLERCIVHDSTDAVIALMSLSDMIAIKGELFDFFGDAVARATAQWSRLSSSESTRSAGPSAAA